MPFDNSAINWAKEGPMEILQPWPLYLLQNDPSFQWMIQQPAFAWVLEIVSEPAKQSDSPVPNLPPLASADTGLVSGMLAG
jgi:hypothetical protein